MPLGIYVRTREHNANISKALQGHFVSKESIEKMKLKVHKDPIKTSLRLKKMVETRKKNGSYKQREEVKLKISQTLKGRIKSIETRKKLSIANLGKKTNKRTY